MIKYLCIDTNIFIQCCLLEITEGDDSFAIDSLLSLLDNDKVKLLLPEVVALEFYRRLEEKTEIIKKQIDQYKEKIGKDGDLDEKIKKDMLSGLSTLIDARLVNKDKVKEKINKIFNHRNTEKDGLEITPDILVESYKDFLGGKKPYKLETKSPIQADCLVIQTLKSYLEDKKDYEFYFCSLNRTDFAESNTADQTQPKNPAIHPELKPHFSHIEYRMNLLTLLKEKFEIEVSDDLIVKLEDVGGIEHYSIEETLPEESISEMIDSKDALVKNTDETDSNEQSL